MIFFMKKKKIPNPYMKTFNLIVYTIHFEIGTFKSLLKQTICINRKLTYSSIFSEFEWLSKAINRKKICYFSNPKFVVFSFTAIAILMSGGDEERRNKEHNRELVIKINGLRI